jgi:FkbM family methyltransferase
MSYTRVLTSAPIGNFSLKKLLQSKYVFLRKKLLKSILHAAGIENIGDHWICTNEINANSIVIDLGANHGNFSKEITTLFHSTCYAIEPNVVLYDAINHENVIKSNYAIASIDAPITFYISKNHEASSILNEFGAQWWEEDRAVTVEGVTFATLREKLNLKGKTIDILKVDIEGAELELFEALTAPELEDIKQISVEFHDWIARDLHDRTVKVIQKLISLGFEGYTDTPSQKWTVEMFFLNKKHNNLSFKQKFFLGLFKKITLIEKVAFHRIYSIFSQRLKLLK